MLTRSKKKLLSLPATTPNQPTLVGCPAETQIQIASYCAPADILSMLLSSPILYRQCQEELYRDVDLSVHNRSEYIDAVELAHNHSRGWLGQPVYGFLIKLRKAQIGFLETMVQKPELAEKVRSIKWTVLGTYSSVLEAIESNQIGSLDFPPDGRLWSVLSSMTKVKTVDIAQACALDLCCRILDMPEGTRLFPNSTSVTLRGYMNVKLATTILQSSDPARLMVLKLDSLRAFTGWLLERGFMGVIEDLPTINEHALYQILNQCKSLERLEIIENGHLWGYSVIADLRIYEDMHRLYGMFMLAAQRTLTTLIYRAQPAVENSWTGMGAETTHFKTMELMFQGKWPRLRILTIPILIQPRDYSVIKHWAYEFMRPFEERENSMLEIHVQGEVFGVWRYDDSKSKSETIKTEEDSNTIKTEEDSDPIETVEDSDPIKTEEDSDTIKTEEDSDTIEEDSDTIKTEEE